MVIQLQYKLTVSKIFAVLSITLFSGAILGLSHVTDLTEDSSSEGDGLFQILSSVIYFLTFYFVFRPRTLSNLIRQNKLLLLLMLISLMSIMWSDFPLITLRRAIAIIGTTVFGAYLAIRYELYELLEIVFVALLLMAVLSILTAIFLPNYGIMKDLHESAWRGVFIHKNTLARIMVLNTIISIVLYKNFKRRIYLVALLMSLILIFFSKSTTGLIMFFTILILANWIRIFRVKRKKLNAVVAVIVIFLSSFGYYFFSNFDTILIGLGKDPTLTGRTILWGELFKMINARPFLGHGYGTFWLGDMGNSRVIWSLVNWTPSQAHNGYIDILLDLGYVGLFLFLILYVGSLKKYLANYILQNRMVYLWGILYFIFLLIYNFSESSFLRQNSVFWILFVSTLISYKRNYTKHNFL